MRLTIAITCILAAAVVPASGTSFSWDGGATPGDYSFQTAANWTSNTGPGCSPGGTDAIDFIAGYLTGSSNPTADWNCSSGTSVYASTYIQSNASYAITFKKSGAGTLNTGTTSLEGYSASVEAHLDVERNMSASSLKTQGYTDIDVATFITLDINGSFSVDACPRSVWVRS